MPMLTMATTGGGPPATSPPWEMVGTARSDWQAAGSARADWSMAVTARSDWDADVGEVDE